MEAIPDPVAFFEEFGGLHDAGVRWFCFDRDELRLDIDNLNAAFNYGGPGPNPYGVDYVELPATLVFSGARNSYWHVGPAEAYGGVIGHAEVKRQNELWSVEFVGSSNWALMFQFDRMRREAAGQPSAIQRYYAKFRN